MPENRAGGVGSWFPVPAESAYRTSALVQRPGRPAGSPGVCTLPMRVLNMVLALSTRECQHYGGIGRLGTVARQKRTDARDAVRRGHRLDPLVRHRGLEPMAAKMIAF